MMRVLVVGFGVTGRATVRAARSFGWPVIVVDDGHTEGEARAGAELGVEIVFRPGQERLEELLGRSDLAVPSPGVPVGHPVYELAARHGVEVVSEVELAGRFLEALPRPRPLLVAITGTNGKTTVTTQVRAALEASGRRAVVAGNIGPPLVEAVVAVPPPDVVVAEVSSFQLQFTAQFHPAVSCWLNLSADHLDWHPTHDHYRAAKARIWANQGAGDAVVVNAGDPDVLAAAAGRPAGTRLVTFAMAPVVGGRSVQATGHGREVGFPAARADWSERDGMLVGPDGLELIAVDDLPRSLPHDRANALATAAVASASGATVEGIRIALRSSMPGPHRVELVGSAAGITWYDDSKATTPAAVVAATAGFASVVLIAGGHNKGLDLAPLATTAPPVHAVVAIGEAAAEVAAAFAGLPDVSEARSMAEAVEIARRRARPGDAVVLSPGCASFDWYPSYAARGDDFAAEARQLMEKERDRC